MINLIINNPEIERIFRTKFNSNLDKFTEFIVDFIKNNQEMIDEHSQNSSKFKYKQLNPMENFYMIDSSNLDTSNLSNPFKDVEDSVEFAKKLRENYKYSINEHSKFYQTQIQASKV